MSGANNRCKEGKTFPLRLDNRCVLQIALVDKDAYHAHERMGQSVRGAAVVYINGPCLGYLPLFAIAPGHRGAGLGGKFVKAILAVLRRINVDVCIVDATVDLDDDDTFKEEQKVLNFWGNVCGMERCTDETLDKQKEVTALTRHARLSGKSLRETAGNWIFPDTVTFFCGTQKGWVLDPSSARPLQLPLEPESGGSAASTSSGGRGADAQQAAENGAAASVLARATEWLCC